MDKIAGIHDVGLVFGYETETYKIVEFRPKAPKNPFVVEDLKTQVRFILPLTDNILKQIRKGRVTNITN